MPRLAQIHDDALGEDIAWRIEFMESRLGLLSAPGALPRFRASPYAPAPGNDHDHCEGCWHKLMVNGDGATLDHGFVASGPDGRPTCWLCPDCHRILEDVTQGRIMPRAAPREAN